MPRFLKVKGKPGLLVAHPNALTAVPRRYAGQRYAPPADAQGVKTIDRYMPVEEIVEDSSSIRAAVSAEELEQIGDRVEAANHAAAAAAFDPPQKAARPAIKETDK